MHGDQASPLLRLPYDVRVMIYGHLLHDNHQRQLSIRNKSIYFCQTSEERAKILKKYTRTQYYAHDTPGWNFSRRYFVTTYTHDELDSPMSTAFMAANRQIYDESSYLLYGLHSFNFGPSVEAAAAFLSDLTPRSKNLIQSVEIRKQSPLRMCHSEYHEWLRTCTMLSRLPNLKKLRIVVVGGKPPDHAITGLPVRRLQPSDFRLLRDVSQPSMEWVDSLRAFTGLETLEIQADIGHMSKPDSSPAMQFAMFSMSIETTFIDFLREEYKLPAKVVPRAPSRPTMACSCMRRG